MHLSLRQNFGTLDAWTIVLLQANHQQAAWPYNHRVPSYQRKVINIFVLRFKIAHHPPLHPCTYLPSHSHANNNNHPTTSTTMKTIRIILILYLSLTTAFNRPPPETNQIKEWYWQCQTADNKCEHWGGSFDSKSYGHHCMASGTGTHKRGCISTEDIFIGLGQCTAPSLGSFLRNDNKLFTSPQCEKLINETYPEEAGQVGFLHELYWMLCSNLLLVAGFLPKRYRGIS